ncbi:MAG: ABC transporter ATP-binding protein [Alphaproteobacteria bacterium]|nr:ABC transporter ATP-binding protein [Alphaproteobacteria bacterium]
MGRYLRPYRGAVLFLLVGMVLESVYEVLARYSLKLIIDQAILPGDYGRLVVLLSMLAGAALVYALTSVGSDFLWAKYGLMVINDMRHDLFVRLQFRGIRFFHRKRNGDLGARFTADVVRIEEGLLYAVPMGAMGLLQVALSLGLMAEMNIELFLLGLLGLVLGLGLPRIINMRALAASYAFHSAEGQLGGHIQENIAAQTVIKAYGLERKAASDFRVELDRLLAVGLRSYFLAFLSQRAPHVVMVLFHLIIFGLGATMVMRESMSLGDLVSFQALFFGLSQSMANVAWLIPSLIDAAASLQRIIEVVDEAPERHEQSGDIDLAPCHRSIDFDGVRFKHDGGAGGVDGLSVSLAAGEFTALVGPTGAGKTTVANLLLRFFEPQAGAITLDGVDIARATIASLRGQIALVPQETILFRTSLRDNIRAGFLDATDREIEEAAKSAGIHAFIAGLPQGYDTVYGESGREFSGGERQRIALARALVRKPAILILDEATSSLDTASEAGILASIRALKGRCTILAITHRLVMARGADRVLVMRDGRLVEDGSHERLAAAGGQYADLWRDRSVDHA